jgi:RNA polymerase sigma-70 factor (ECF subfamily)
VTTVALRESNPVHSAPTDTTLFARIHDGDTGALGLLYDRYDRDVRRVIARLGVPPSDVDDLVQATFLEVLRCADRYDGRECGKPWLIGLAVIMVRRHRRSLARLAARLSSWATLPSGIIETPEESVGASQAADRAQRALNRLSPKKREAFVLLALEGLSGEEAAKSVGAPLQTVWTRLHHARRELRAVLEET